MGKACPGHRVNLDAPGRGVKIPTPCLKTLVEPPLGGYNILVLVLSAKSVSEALYLRLRQELAEFRQRVGRPPSLATILVGDDPASRVYVAKKGQMCADLGYGHKDYKLPASTLQKDLLQLVHDLNADDAVDGILVQKPLPPQINERVIFDALDPLKDVDCFSPQNVGLLSQGRGTVAPCTPAGVMEILSHYQISPRGMNALVVGRSDIVGKPMAQLLLQADATVTMAHSRTTNLAAHIATADLVVAAIGRPQMLGGDLPWKSTAVVIDVGINRLPTGKLAGDVNYEQVAPKVKAITPVPGGVGPMTIAMLMANTLTLARARTSLEHLK